MKTNPFWRYDATQQKLRDGGLFVDKGPNLPSQRELIDRSPANLLNGIVAEEIAD